MERLRTQSPKISFLKYAVPSVLGMLLMAVNIIIDGVFVGHALGPVALAGVNVAFPVYNFFIALSLWIGMGVTTLYSNALGEGNRDKAKTIFTQGISLIFCLTVLITVIAFLIQDHLISWLGANEEIAPYAKDYLGIILIFGFVFTVENTLSIFVRNDGNPNLSMAALITTSVVNIILNYILLFELNVGLRGAAIALVVAGICGSLVLSTHFLKKTNNLKLRLKDWNNRLFRKVFHIGFPSFLAEIGSAVFIISYNISIVRVAGTVGGAAFSMISYTHAMVLMLFIGLSSALQPLVSFYKGAGMEKEQRQVRTYAVFSALGIGIAFIIFAQLSPDTIIGLFGHFSPEIEALARESIRIFFFAYLFMGINFVMITYFQISGNTNFAILLTSLREIGLLIILLILLPPLLGTVGVWLAVPVSEFCIFCLVIYYSRKNNYL